MSSYFYSLGMILAGECETGSRIHATACGAAALLIAYEENE